MMKPPTKVQPIRLRKSQPELNNDQCDSCQQTETALLKDIKVQHHLKKKNDLLRDQLKEINREVDAELKKFLQNNNKSTHNSNYKQYRNTSKKELLENELKNMQQMEKYYIKRIKELKDISNDGDIDQYYRNQINVYNKRMEERNRIQNNNQEIKETIKIQKRNLRYVDDTNDLKLQLTYERDQIGEQLKQENKLGVNGTSLKIYIDELEKRHREVCEQFGVPFEVKNITEEDLQNKLPKIQNKKNQWLKERQEEKSLQQQKIDRYQQAKKGSQSVTNLKPLNCFQNHRSSHYGIRNRDLTEVQQEEQQLEKILSKNITTKQLQEQQRQIKIVEDSIKSYEIQFQQHMRMMEKENVQLKSTLFDIEQTISQRQQLLEENIDAKNSLQEIAKNTKQQNQAIDQLRQIKGGNESDVKIDHLQELPDTQDYKITELKIDYVDEYILGFSITYQTIDGKKQMLSLITADESVQPQSVTLKLRGVEYINTITGYHNGSNIQYLKIQTSQRNYVVVGNEKSIQKSEKFFVNLQKGERILTFLGHTQEIKVQKKFKILRGHKCLSLIGAHIIQKDAFDSKRKQGISIQEELKKQQREQEQLLTEESEKTPINKAPKSQQQIQEEEVKPKEEKQIKKECEEPAQQPRNDRKSMVSKEKVRQPNQKKKK